jgi:hypothetical protein
MSAMWRSALLILLVVGCGSDEDDSLNTSIQCEADGSCPRGYSCLVAECIQAGSLEIGDTCLQEEQCGEQLTCHNFLCKPGCSRVYEIDDCPENEWCKPLADASPPAGDCTPSECDPATTDFCDQTNVCVAFAIHTGGCLPYCEYGFTSGAYHDSCVDTFTDNFACQALGLNHAPVCLAGGNETGPGPGDAGCNFMSNPCQPSSTCINVVCRELCLPDVPNTCELGENCVPIGSRSDIAYCRAQ